MSVYVCVGLLFHGHCGLTLRHMASFIKHIGESRQYLTRIVEQLTASAALQPASQLTGIDIHDLPVLTVQGKPERQWGLVSLLALV